MMIIKIGELLSVRTENCVEPDQSPRTDWKCRLSSAEKIWGPKDMQNSLEKDKEICNGWKRSKITKSKPHFESYFLIQVKLKEYEKIIYQRYIEAEKEEPDFLKKGKATNFMREVFLFIYLAGHGCADFRQYFLLNEKTIDKIFWKAEYTHRKLLDRVGSECKLFAVYDCCREDYQEALQKLIEHQKSKNVYQQ